MYKTFLCSATYHSRDVTPKPPRFQGHGRTQVRRHSVQGTSRLAQSGQDNPVGMAYLLRHLTDVDRQVGLGETAARGRARAAGARARSARAGGVHTLITVYEIYHPQVGLKLDVLSMST